MVLALALVEVLMPQFNAFLGRTIVFDYWRNPELAAGIAGAVLLVGTLAGVYPALVLSAFPPAWVLSSRSGGRIGFPSLAGGSRHPAIRDLDRSDGFDGNSVSTNQFRDARQPAARQGSGAPDPRGLRQGIRR